MSEAPLWTPPADAWRTSQLGAFRDALCERTGASLPTWRALSEYAVREADTFWAFCAEWLGVVPADTHPIIAGAPDVERAIFFPNATLNYARALLAPGDDADTAIIAATERGDVTRLSRGDVRDGAARVAGALSALGVVSGSRVCALTRNTAEPLIACLGATAVGAIWSSANTDLGPEAILARFTQVAPEVLIVHAEHRQHGAVRDLAPVIARLTAALPSLKLVVHLEPLGAGAVSAAIPTVHWAGWLASAKPLTPSQWPSFPFNHPLFALFSSGTTGIPKAIVHGAGGTLLEHLKEHRLHGDLRPDDVLAFQTTCGWMMWNWQLSALAAGAAILAYDGSPTFPAPDAFWQLVDRERVSVLGTSPAYLQMLRDLGIRPSTLAPLSALRAIQSTGSVLSAELFRWAADAIKPIPVQSISGGTDIIGCFVLGNPVLPVYAGDSQCVSLGCDVQVDTTDGVRATGTGELVCTQPFPSRPIGFLRDPDAVRYHDAYFAQREGVWTHGDQVVMREDGRARILGRSDGILNVRGVRIGPAEILEIVRKIPGVADAMALEQQAPRELGGTRLVLLVVLAAGTTLDRALQMQIKRALRDGASSNHVPAVIAAVSDLPTTFSGKRSLRAASDALHGRSVANVEAIRNPGVLEELRGHAALHSGGVPA